MTPGFSLTPQEHLVGHCVNLDVGLDGLWQSISYLLLLAVSWE